MLRKIRERIQSEESGFTLIELLVVILIIGILAAIAIPAFLGQREKAQDSEAKSAVRTAASAAKTFYTDNQTYEGMTAATLQKVEPSLKQGQGATLAVAANGAVGYTLTVTSKANGGKNTYTITEENGVAARTCDVDGEAGCPSNGLW